MRKLEAEGTSRLSVERTHAGALRVFSIDLPEPAVGALCFRVGIADEALAVRGISHLVEHLALYAVGSSPELTINGQVGPDFTTLWARGSRAGVLSFLGDVSRAVADLPMARLEDERRVLRTEASRAQGTSIQRVLTLRFGAHGYGMTNYVEKGLEWLDAERIQEWANTRFCAENAVLFLTAPPDEDLALELPRSEPALPPPIDQRLDQEFPLHVADGTGGVALTLVAERSWAAVAALNIAVRELAEELRVKRAISYAVTPNYVPLGVERAHLTIGADCLDENAGLVQDEVVRAVNRLASNGPTDQALEEWKESWRDLRPDPDDRARGELERTAKDVLLGRIPESPESLEAGLEALSTDDVAQALADAADTRLLLVPAGIRSQPAGFSGYRSRYIGLPEGKVFRVRRKGLRKAANRRQLIVGDDRLALIPAEGDPIVIRIADCIGVERGSSGIQVFSRSGVSFRFDPAELRDPEGAVGALRSRIPAEYYFPPEPATSDPPQQR